MQIAGLLLAAGSGRRFGMPKALADSGDGPWVLTALAVLESCAPRLVVVGARGEDVAALLPADVVVVRNPDHAGGMSSSLRAGLTALPADVDAVLVTLVDLPDVTPAVATRVLTAAGSSPRTALARATFDGRPGHPVLIGRDHVAGLLDDLEHGDPDAGAGRYLARHGVTAADCSDLAGGLDVDRPVTH